MVQPATDTLLGVKSAPQALLIKSASNSAFLPQPSRSHRSARIKKVGQNNRFVLKNSEVRVNSFPSIDVDRTEGPRRGWIYVAWADQRTTAPGSGTPDILLIKSTDNGATWSSPVRVNNVTTNDQWFPFKHFDRHLIHRRLYSRRQFYG
jgi:hypothetical protein